MAIDSENSSGVITTLQKHIEDMRNLVQCKICLKPLYEPYMLSCGHTYCYSCLSNWFQQLNDRKRNCPDCRTPVKIQPAPNFLLRDLTHMFISRTELLPEDETVEDHIAEKEAEAAILVEHKQGRGLFNGLFRGPLIDRLFPPRGPIRDYEDGVERCPLCAWEVEDGRCMGCGIVPDPDADIEFSEIDLSDEDSSSSEGTPSVDNRRPPAPARFYGIDTDEDDDEDADSRAGDGPDPDQYDPHDDFIDDENEDDMDDMDNVDHYGDYPSDAGTPYSDSTNMTTETFEGHMVPPYHGNGGGRIRSRNPESAADSSDVQEDYDGEEDEEDEEEIVRPRRRAGPARQRARPIVIEENEEEEERSRSEEEDEDGPVSGRPARRLRQTSSSTDRSITHLTGHTRSETPEGSASAQFSELDETATSEARSEASGTDETGDESDDTAIPPQTGRARRQRLQQQRAARQAHTAPGNRITIDLVTPPARQRSYGRPANHRDMARDGRRSRATPVY